MENKNDVMIASECGYRDYRAGCPKTTNPYKLPILKKAYEEGYEEAELEYLARKKQFRLTLVK